MNQFPGPTGPEPNGAPPLDQPYYGCPPQAAFTRFFRKYATFSGRASRSEYWWWTLIASGIAIVLQGLVDAADNLFGIHLAFLATLWQLGTMVPTFAVSVRRLHDTDRSGGWIALPIALSFAGSLLIIGGLAGGMFGVIASLRSSRHGAATLGVSGVVFLIGAAMVVAGAIVDIVFMASPSKPEGARFDAVPRRYGAPVDAYGNPYGAYGNPYGTNPYGGQAPTGPTPNGQAPNGQEPTAPTWNPPANGPHGR